jgi:ATP-dependent Clp protease ATP-binding subunit ClpA
MFDRFTEAAKRVIFFARYEAAQAGSHAIESAHLLLGILRDGRGPAQRILSTYGVTRELVEQVRKSRGPVSGPASTEIPLSEESKRILTNANSESEKGQGPGTDTTHILLGILSQEECLAAVALSVLGLRRDEADERLAELSKHPAWRNHELVEKLGIKIAHKDISLRQRLSDAELKEVEELLVRARALADATEAAVFGQAFERLATLQEEEMALRDRLRHLLVD